jgi:hypothetical protein
VWHACVLALLCVAFAQSPTVNNPPDLSGPIGPSFSLSFSFDNADTTFTGYGPIVDIILPTKGIDGGDGVDASTLDVTVFGIPAEFDIIPFTTTCVNHPYSVDPFHVPLQVCAQIGDSLLAIRYARSNKLPMLK